MDPLYQQLGVAAALIATLIGGIRWMATRNDKLEAKLEKASDACVAREGLLVLRIQSLEESRAKELGGLATSCNDALRDAAEALRINARAFEKVVEESGGFRAIGKPK